MGLPTFQSFFFLQISHRTRCFFFVRGSIPVNLNSGLKNYRLSPSVTVIETGTVTDESEMILWAFGVRQQGRCTFFIIEKKKL